MDNIRIRIEGKLENGKTLFGLDTQTEIDSERIYKIKRLCNEWKIDFEDLIIYFIENITPEEADKIIDKMDLCGIRELFGITE